MTAALGPPTGSSNTMAAGGFATRLPLAAAAFEAIGRGGLYRAASRRGGVARWKREVGVD